jgi:hypothetical protein
MRTNKKIFSNGWVILFLALVGWATSPAWGLDVPLTVVNREAVAKSGEPITSGVPFAEGILTDISRVRILLGGAEIPAQFKVTARWPDGSIRWLLADFQIDLPAAGTVSLVLQTGVTPAAVSGVIVDDQPATLTVNTGTQTFVFSKTQFVVIGNAFQVVSGGTVYQAVPQATNWLVEENGPLKTVVRVQGNWVNGGALLGNALIRFQARLFFFRNKDILRSQLTFKNNNSFGWDSAQGLSITLSGASFSIPLLPGGGTYVFGQGVEKTWDVDISAAGTPSVRDSRYNGDGSLAAGYVPPCPLAVAAPAYYGSTRAWGQITLPPAGFPSDAQAEFDRFEKLQRSKVIAANLENPPGLTGITLWEHLRQDIGRWNDYGDQRWAGDNGSLSGNHYDWPYGMFLQFFRTGFFPFLDMARVLAKHEIDFDIYHTAADGTAFNYQKNWESRDSHDTPDNTFGGGRPSHTWCQGYALMWLLVGDYRGKDAFEEILEGVRQYVYESFNVDGYIDTNEIRIQGWLSENLITLWRINPQAVWTTSSGAKTIPQALKDVLKSVFDLEAAAGLAGFVFDGDPPQMNLRAPLQNLYFLEPAIKAYAEVFKNRDAAYAPTLLALIRRMTDWLISITMGGTTNASGHYLPRQIPYRVDTTLPVQNEGQLPYLLMAANAAGFCFQETGVRSYADYMRAAFLDFMRYVGVVAGDTYVTNPALRTATSYNSNIFVGTESKIHGWTSRYGQYYLAAESTSAKDDFVGVWAGQGIFYRNSDSGRWVLLEASTASQIVVSDLDGDGIADLIGVFPSDPGVWVKKSSTNTWTKLDGVTPNWIAAGDMNGDGRPDFIGAWADGVYYKNSVLGQWVLLETSAASQVAAGDLDGDGRDDLVGIWPGDPGVWTKRSSTLTWLRLDSLTPSRIAVGDMNGDGRPDLLGTWPGSGVYYRNSATGTWVLMETSVASQVAAGDLDGDGRKDLIGVFPSDPGVWVKRSSTSTWLRLDSLSPACIAAGRMRAAGMAGSADRSEIMFARPGSSPFAGGYDNLSNFGPHGRNFTCRVEDNAQVGIQVEVGQQRRLPPGPGEPGFKPVREDIPPQNKKK